MPDKTIVTYDELGRIKQQTFKGVNSSDRTTDYTYNDTNNTTTIARPESVTETVKRDSRGNIIQTSKTVNGDTQTTRYEYNSLNKVTKIVDALDNITTFEYDNLGNQISSTATDAQTGSAPHFTAFEYNNLGWKTQTTDAMGRIFTSTYDGVGNTITSTENGLRTTTNTYDKLNRQTQVTVTAGGVTLNTSRLRNLERSFPTKFQGIQPSNRIQFGLNRKVLG